VTLAVEVQGLSSSLSRHGEEVTKIVQCGLTSGLSEAPLHCVPSYCARKFWKKLSTSFEAIVALRQRCEEQILRLGKRAKKGQALLRELYSQPVMSANDIANKLGITHQSASSLIRSFEEMGIFREITGRKKDRLLSSRNTLACLRAASLRAK